MAGTAWPTLLAGARAKASEVESKFDWVEQDLVPMSGGSKADATYDLGQSTFRWRDAYFSRQVLLGNGSVGTPSLSLQNSPTTGFYRSGADAMALSSAGVQTWNMTANGEMTVPLQPCFYAAGGIGTTTGTANLSLAESFDIGADYSAPSFLVPVSGRYVIGAYASVIGTTTAATLTLRITAGGTQYDDVTSDLLTTVGLQVNVIANLTAGNSISCSIIPGIAGNNWTGSDARFFARLL